MQITLSILFILLSLMSGFAQVVSTQYGQIQGSQNGNVFQFLGIPYAKPPVVSELNTLRWKAPQKPEAWIAFEMPLLLRHLAHKNQKMRLLEMKIAYI